MRRTLAVSLLLSTCGGCLADRQLARIATEQRLPWLKVGQTQRGELLQRLGQPVRSFEGGRLLVWRVPEHGEQPFEDPGRQEGEYLQPKPQEELDVTVLFDSSDRVERISVVKP
jgi:hypothetical protein